MAKSYTALPTISLITGCTCDYPTELPEMAHLNEPALHVMTDFTKTRPYTISADGTIEEALTEMKVCGVRLLLVIDKDRHLLGLISSEDLLGEKPLKVMKDRAIRRTDIRINMLMTQQGYLEVLDIAKLQHAKVGHVVETLLHLQQHYVLVVETVGEKQRVRGLFSASQINRQVGKDVLSGLAEAHSRAEMEHDLHLYD